MGFTSHPSYFAEGHESAAHLLDVEVSEAIAFGNLSHPGGIFLDDFTEELDGRRRSVHLPLKYAQLPEVRPSVARQRLTVLKVEPAELAAGVWWGQSQENAVLFTKNKRFTNPPDL